MATLPLLGSVSVLPDGVCFSWQGLQESKEASKQVATHHSSERGLLPGLETGNSIWRK